MRSRFKLTILLVVCLFVGRMQAQTPIANRVKAMARHLPAGANVVAKYTDNRRHCLYYSLHNRLFRYDVIKNKSEDVEFSSSGYARLLDAFISPNGDFIFIVVTKIKENATEPHDNEELWRYDSHARKSAKIGSGFGIEHRRDCIVIKKMSRRLNPSRPFARQQWFVKKYFYDFDGHILYDKDDESDAVKPKEN